jgi:hypothetical protein
MRSTLFFTLCSTLFAIVLVSWLPLRHISKLVFQLLGSCLEGVKRALHETFFLVFHR